MISALVLAAMALPWTAGSQGGDGGLCGTPPRDPWAASSAGGPVPFASSSLEPFPASADGGLAPTTEERASSNVELVVDTRDTLRGARLHVRGTVSADGDGCPFARVDLTLRARDGRAFSLGSVPTDGGGRFAADLTVPLQVDVGEYTLIGRTPGAGECGASQ